MSQFFTLSGQSIEASASASVLPVNIQDWFPLGLTDLISLQSKGLFTVKCSHMMNYGQEDMGRNDTYYSHARPIKKPTLYPSIVFLFLWLGP